MRLDNGASLVNELESPIIENLEATDDADRSKLFSKMYLFINLIANIVPSLLNEKNLSTLVKFLSNHKVNWILPKFKLFQ